VASGLTTAQARRPGGQKGDLARYSRLFGFCGEHPDTPGSNPSSVSNCERCFFRGLSFETVQFIFLRQLSHDQVSRLSGTDRDCRPTACKLRWQMQHRSRGTWLQWRLIVEIGFWRYPLRAVVYGAMMRPCVLR